MPPRYTEEEVERIIIPQLINAIYPVLIPIEQQDCATQARNYANMERIAKEIWRMFGKTSDAK